MDKTNELMQTPVTTKAGIEQTKDDFIENLLDSGDTTGCEVAVKVKVIEELIKQVKEDKRYKDFVVKDIEKQNKGEKINGVGFSVINKSTYDYSECGSTKLAYLEKQAKEIKKKIDEEKNFLKSLSDSSESFDKGSGELLKPPTKKTTTSFSVTLPKK